MNDRMMLNKKSCDRTAVAAMVIPAVVLPSHAWALQVGCFVTAVFLGIMFLVGLGLTVLVKHLLAKHLWKVPQTPWLRLFGITWIELLIGIMVFAVVRTSYWMTVLLYLPLASLVNSVLLARFRQPAGGAAPFLQRYGVFLLLAAALPLSLQFAGALWSAITNLITFTDLQM